MGNGFRIMKQATISYRGVWPQSESFWVSICALLATVSWTYLAGKDASWDVYNHHLYLPFSLLTGRYATDLFAAGPQSYQNPIGYLPFYLLVKTGLPSWLIGAALAGLHAALTVWPIHRIANTIWPYPEDRSWRWMAMAAVWCTPVFLIVAGTSSIDPIGAGLALLAAAAVLERKPSPRLLLLGAAAVGLAAAIKPTSAVFAIAAGVVLLWRCALGQIQLSRFGLFCVSCIASFLVFEGFWAWWLWKTFQNPVFPLYNQIFASPFIPADAAAASRFVPTGIVEYVARLWQMVEFRSYVITEAFVPDLRPIVATLAALALGVWTARLYGLRHMLRRELWLQPGAQLAALLVVSYPLWMAITGNARYAIAWFMLIGVALVRAVQLVLPRAGAKVFLGVLIAVQVMAYAGVGQRRYVGDPWDSEPYFSVTTPKRLLEEPFLHLSLGVQTFASVATYLNPHGALINLSGQFSLPADGLLGAAVKKRLAEWQGRTRFLFQAPPHFEDPETIAAISRRMRHLAYRFGLGIDWSDCEVIWIGWDRKQSPTLLTPQADKASSPLMSCGAVARTARDTVLEAQMARADQVFSLLQKQCPSVYGPPPLVSDIGDDVIQRRYVNTDLRVNVSPTKGVFLAHFRSLNTIALGSIDEVIASQGRDACSAWQKLWTP